MGDARVDTRIFQVGPSTQPHSCVHQIQSTNGTLYETNLISEIETQNVGFVDTFHWPVLAWGTRRASRDGRATRPPSLVQRTQSTNGTLYEKKSDF